MREQLSDDRGLTSPPGRLHTLNTVLTRQGPVQVDAGEHQDYRHRQTGRYGRRLQAVERTRAAHQQQRAGDQALGDAPDHALATG